MIEVTHTGLWEQNISISFQLHNQWCDFDSLGTSRVKIFTTWKLVNTTYYFFPPRSGLPRYYSIYSFWVPITQCLCCIYNNGFLCWFLPIILSDAKNTDFSLSKLQFPSVPGTQFACRRKGIWKDRKKNVDREGDREEGSCIIVIWVWDCN